MNIADDTKNLKTYNNGCQAGKCNLFSCHFPTVLGKQLSEEGGLSADLDGCYELEYLEKSINSNLIN